MFLSKKIAAAATAFLMAAPVFAQTDMLGVPGPIPFQGQSYALAWSSQPSQAYVKHEYVPKGQTVESYNDMFMVEALSGAITPEQAAASQVQSLNERKKTDPVVNHAIVKNDATGEVLLDFIVSDMSANPIVVEWNAYRYVPLKQGQGIALFAISRRAYGQDNAQQFLKDLSAARTKDINALAAYKTPALRIGKKALVLLREAIAVLTASKI